MTSPRLLSVLAVFCLIAIFAFAGKPDPLAELIARADAARPEDRPAIYVEIATHQLKAADEAYTAGKIETARAAVNDVVTYSTKAHDASIQTAKKLKSTEIALRKMAARLRDIQRSLSYEDQPPVQAAAEQLENLRTDLLTHMFGKAQN